MCHGETCNTCGTWDTGGVPFFVLSVLELSFIPCFSPAQRLHPKILLLCVGRFNFVVQRCFPLISCGLCYRAILRWTTILLSTGILITVILIMVMVVVVVVATLVLHDFSFLIVTNIVVLDNIR